MSNFYVAFARENTGHEKKGNRRSIKYDFIHAREEVLFKLTLLVPNHEAKCEPQNVHTLH